MKHSTIEKVLERAEHAKSDSDFTYFYSLLFAAEALAKTMVLGMVASIADDKDRNRYRLEHQLVRANGLGEWGQVIEEAVTGSASDHLLSEANDERTELIRRCKEGEWQYDATNALKSALNILDIESENVDVKSDLKRWFRLFVTLRNKTRGHGATKPEQAAFAAEYLAKSIELIYRNFKLFKRPWAYLHRNLNGKYRISPITDNVTSFDPLKKVQDRHYKNGVYLFMGGAPRPITLISSNAELSDFFFANGGMTGKKFEMLSYASNETTKVDATAFLTPPGSLPDSETQGYGELRLVRNCFTNSPDPVSDYVKRPKLETELLSLLRDDRRSIVTLLGRGGIGKTSLALKVIPELYDGVRFECVVWLSARDVDLQFTGPKPVRPMAISPDEMSKFYASLVLSPEKLKEKGFSARAYFEQQLQKCDLGPCLFVFDNFETTQNPVDMFNWIDTFIRLPNKALITTRLREFKGDYPVEVSGMEEQEALQLIEKTAVSIGIKELIDPDYASKLVVQTEGHPYVIKILLGEVAKLKKAANISMLIVGTEDVLTALFERTYGSLSPCSQRAFLTLSAWNSPVPRLALEAVLYRSTQERCEVERGIESLLQYSMAEVHTAPLDKQEFISLPLVASVFGKKKLNISRFKAAIMSDVEILLMFGPSRNDDIRLGLVKKLKYFINNISKRIEDGESYDSFEPVLDAICHAYNPGWLLVARWLMENRTQEGYDLAKKKLNTFLENSDSGTDAADAWRLLGIACLQTGDTLGVVHASIERAQIIDVDFNDLSSTANSLNVYFKEHGAAMEIEQKKDLAQRLLSVLHARSYEASGDDLSRMAWLAIYSGQENQAREYIQNGLSKEPDNNHLIKLDNRLNC